MVDVVWKLSEFYLKNWIFDNILNSMLMFPIEVNANRASLNISLSLMEQSIFVKINDRPLSGV